MPARFAFVVVDEADLVIDDGDGCGEFDPCPPDPEFEVLSRLSGFVSSLPDSQRSCGTFLEGSEEGTW